MSARPRHVRWQRLGLMVLVAALTVAGLASQPVPRDEGPRLRRAPLPLPRPAPRLPALPGVARATATAADDVEPATPASDPAALDGTAGADGSSPPGVGPHGPDIVVALEWPDARPPLLRTSYVHATDSAQPTGGLALPLVDAVGGSGDGIEGFEPGMLYWFGPRGLEKLAAAQAPQNVQLTSMEAQR